MLYHLPEVITADAVWLVEGERDADSLHELGLCGATCPLGAGKWPKLCKEHGIHEPLRGKHAVICPDNDSPGKRHAQDIAPSLIGIAASVKVLELPGLDEKQDVSDFIAMHGPVEAKRLLLELAESTPEYQTQESCAPSLHSLAGVIQNLLASYRERKSRLIMQRFLAAHTTGSSAMELAFSRLPAANPLCRFVSEFFG